VGAVAESLVDVRLLSATHKDLALEVQSGRFRQDLFYRLNVIQIRVPPLRERSADLGEIASQVLRRIAADAGISPAPRLTSDALQHLCHHDFPGNVRELENLLYRAVALSEGGDIDVGALGLPGQEATTFRPSAAPPPPAASPAEPPATAWSAGVTPEAMTPEASSALPNNLEAHLDAIERDILVRALERHRNNRTAAGASLGLSLRQMRYRMARLQIGVASDAGSELDGLP
jgi:two-component system response regulator PilR (NtrC family)